MCGATQQWSPTDLVTDQVTEHAENSGAAWSSFAQEIWVVPLGMLDRFLTELVRLWSVVLTSSLEVTYRNRYLEPVYSERVCGWYV